MSECGHVYVSAGACGSQNHQIPWELESQAVVSHWCGCWEASSGPLEEPSPQPQQTGFKSDISFPPSAACVYWSSTDRNVHETQTHAHYTAHTVAIQCFIQNASCSQHWIWISSGEISKHAVAARPLWDSLHSHTHFRADSLQLLLFLSSNFQLEREEKYKGMSLLSPVTKKASPLKHPQNCSC